MEIRITVRDAVDAQDGVDALSKMKLPVKMAYQVSKLQRKLKDEVSSFLEVRNKLVEELGEVDEKSGQTIIKPGPKLEQFTKEIDQILDEEIVIERVKEISIADLEKLEEDGKLDEIEPLILTKLASILDEGEDEEPKDEGDTATV